MSIKVLHTLKRASGLFGNPEGAFHDGVAWRWCGRAFRLHNYDYDHGWMIDRQMSHIEGIMRWDFTNDQNYIWWDEPFLMDAFNDPVVPHLEARIPYDGIYAAVDVHPSGLHCTACKGFYAHYVRKTRRWFRQLF